MACETEMWLHQKNVTTLCPHPAIVHCEDCRAGLCSSHIVECETCGHFICHDCAAEHYREHRRKETELRRRN